jgi:exosortase
MLLGVIVALIFVMFHLLGNTFQNVPTRSVFVWMVMRWQDPAFGADYSHGWLIPIVSLAVVWYRRKELAAAPRGAAAAGLVWVAAALALHWIGARIQQPRLSLFSFALLLLAIPYSLYGAAVARLLVFPCAYLLFCIPWNFLDTLSFPLRMLSARVSTALLVGLGLDVQRSGSAIHVGGGLALDVADPCSGLRSLLAMMALVAAYAFFTQRSLMRKWALFLLSIPVAILSNVVRITTIALVGQAFGMAQAMKIYHDYSGYLIFVAGTLMVVGAGQLLNRDYREFAARWKHAS